MGFNLKRPRRRTRLTWGAQIISALLAACFCLTVITTDASHCEEACPEEEPRLAELLANAHGAVAPHTTPELRAAHTADRDHGPACIGASCLCHQHRLSEGSHLTSSQLPVCLTTIHVVRSPAEGDVGEILHVPKPAA